MDSSNYMKVFLEHWDVVRGYLNSDASCLYIPSKGVGLTFLGDLVIMRCDGFPSSTLRFKRDYNPYVPNGDPAKAPRLVVA